MIATTALSLWVPATHRPCCYKWRCRIPEGTSAASCAHPTWYDDESGGKQVASTDHDRRTDLDATQDAALLEKAIFEVKRVIVGQDQLVERVLVGLLAKGHILLEGVPGVAKTLAVETFAKVVGGSFSRVQFTPDLVPTDLIGTRIFRQGKEQFDIELGPVVANFVLADEINRAPAKVQSALLEVMAERQVSIGGRTFPMPDPFLVMATQNPIENEGVYPLPEAQRDRFLFKIVVDYPTIEEEREIVYRMGVEPPTAKQILDPAELIRLQAAASSIFVHHALVDYVVRVIFATRAPEQFGMHDVAAWIAYGASPRATLGIISAARATALLRGRDYVIPRDVIEVIPDVLRHRLVLSYDALADEVTPESIIGRVLQTVGLPQVTAQPVGGPAPQQPYPAQNVAPGAVPPGAPPSYPGAPAQVPPAQVPPGQVPTNGVPSYPQGQPNRQYPVQQSAPVGGPAVAAPYPAGPQQTGPQQVPGPFPQAGPPPQPVAPPQGPARPAGYATPAQQYPVRSTPAPRVTTQSPAPAPAASPVSQPASSVVDERSAPEPSTPDTSTSERSTPDSSVSGAAPQPASDRASTGAPASGSTDTGDDAARTASPAGETGADGPADTDAASTSSADRPSTSSDRERSDRERSDRKPSDPKPSDQTPSGPAGWTSPASNR